MLLGIEFDEVVPVVSVVDSIVVVEVKITGTAGMCTNHDALGIWLSPIVIGCKVCGGPELFH